MSGTGPWWESAVGYEVYLSSFADSDGDGWGDLRGVVEHLDHLVWLGVDVLWLTPFYASPLRDGGYDISDHRLVDVRYGGEAALSELIEAAHTAGLRVLADLVVNHTSSAHQWFKDARTSRDAAFRAHYIWRDADPHGPAPNNWVSHFGGPAWTRTPETGQSYLHLFTTNQPDLNWANPAVADIIEHWLRRGMDGFRIDTAGYLAKEPDLRDNPGRAADDPLDVTAATLAWRLQDHRHDINQDQTADIHRRWRQIADQHDAVLIGEICDLDPVGLARYTVTGPLHSAFWFGLVETGWNPERVADLLIAAASSTAHAWTLGNHDRPRAATRFATSDDHSRVTDQQPSVARRTLAVHAALALLPGQLWIYQGDELGMTNAVVDTDDTTDPLAGSAPDQNRAVSRSPMPWHPGPGHGFTAGRGAWLTCEDRTDTATVHVQRGDDGSILIATRRLLAARRDAQPDVRGHRAVATRPTPTALPINRGPAAVIVYLDDLAVPLSDVAPDLMFADIVYDTGHPATTPPANLNDLAPLEARWYRATAPDVR